MTQFDIRRIPFSRFGSYLAISDLGPPHKLSADVAPGIWLRAFSGESAKELFKLELLVNGQPVEAGLNCDEAVLSLCTPEGGPLRMTWAGSDRLQIAGEKVGLRLQLRGHEFNGVSPISAQKCRMIMFSAFRVFQLTARRGRVAATAGWGVKGPHTHVDLLPDEEGFLDVVLDRRIGSTFPDEVEWKDFEETAAEVRNEFAAFAEPQVRGVPEAFVETARLAAYVNWSAVVHAEGLNRRPAMLMSKNWMSCVWSWDHAFNALALAPTHSELAWDQLQLPYDHQLPTGELPDFFNSILMLHNFNKPPVQGWIAMWMLRHTAMPEGRDGLAHWYDQFSRQVRYWPEYRRREGSDLLFLEHGNDGGWDNATVYDGGLPVRSPELTAYTITMLDVLAEWAGELNRPAEASEWRSAAEVLLKALVEEAWCADGFVYHRLSDGDYDHGARSLLPYMVLVLGERLPLHIRETMIQRIQAFLTEWGPATEEPGTARYEAEGYWRGPIWGPSTLIVADGLRRSGAPDLAHEVALKYCRLCRKSGFPENFNALTGEPLRDPAYTWTSSVFLTLAREFLNPGDQ
jgi:hypothetical protein